MAKIGVFGGTFNPPHLGHVLAAKEVKKALGLSKILLIPDKEPPHKEMPEGSPDQFLRLSMLEAAVAGDQDFQISDLEFHRPGKSYTSHTLEALKELYPEDTLYLIMGTDMFLSLHTWHEPEKICSLAVIAAMHRDQWDRTGEMEQQKKALEQAYGARVELVSNQRVEISSTKVRRMLVLGGAEKYVCPQVMDIIRAQGLYGTGRDYRNLSNEELKNVAVGLLKKKRVAHVLGCAETAVKLAERYGQDKTVAYRAGLLHDVTKAIDGEDQLLLVEKYGILIRDYERKNPKLLHAKTGAAVAKYVFGESEAVVDAICWHTTGRPDMTPMEKIIYLADYMEPNRDFPGVAWLRETTFRDLDEGLRLGLTLCIGELEREKKIVCNDSRDALAYIEAQLGGPVDDKDKEG